MKKFYLAPCLFANIIGAAHIAETQALSSITSQAEIRCFSAPASAVEREAQAAFQYYLDEVELDASLTNEEQHGKVQEFKRFAEGLFPEAASLLSTLLLQETRSRIIDILHNAELETKEIQAYLDDYEEVILGVQNMTVEIARQMLFFVAELKSHRQYVYEFGIALGCPEKQLLRHDLCKLRVEQFEGYARYFRGGKQEDDKLAYLTAWEVHQNEEHHHESYRKDGFSFDDVSEERLRNNMLEAVADLLAATKQRGGSTLIDWLVKVFPTKNPHPLILPFLEEALIKSHAFYLDSEKNQDSDSIFKGFPCWNSDVEEVFLKLKGHII